MVRHVDCSSFGTQSSERKRRKRGRIGYTCWFLCPRAIPLQLDDGIKYRSISNYLVDRHLISIKPEKGHVDEIRTSLNWRRGFNNILDRLPHQVSHATSLWQGLGLVKYAAEMNTLWTCLSKPSHICFPLQSHNPFWNLSFLMPTQLDWAEWPIHHPCLSPERGIYS